MAGGNGLKRLKRNILLAAASALLITISATLVIGYSFWVKIDQAGGLTQYLQNNLNSRSTSVFSTIEEASVEFRFAAAPVRLKASNVRLNAADTSLILPQSEFGFTLTSLLFGRFVPSELSVSGLEIEIEHGAKGWHAGPSMALITSLLRDGQGGGGGNTLSALRKLYIGNARLKVSQPSTTIEGEQDWVIIEPIAITLNHRSDRLEGNIVATNPGGGEVAVDFTSNESGTDMNLAMTVAGLEVQDIYPYIGVNIPEIRGFGLIDGRLTVAVRDRKITSLSGDVVSKDGAINLPGHAPIDYNQASMIFAHDVVEDVLTVSSVDVEANMPGSDTLVHLLLSGQVKQLSSDKPVVFGKIKGSNIPLESALLAWPETADPSLRTKVTNAVQGGTIASLGIETVGVIDRRQQQFEITTIDLVTDMRSLRLETGFASIERLVGTLATRLELSIGNNGIIKHAAADFLLTDTLLQPKNSPRLIDIEGVELRTKLVGKTIQVTRAAVDARELGQMALIAEIDVEDDWHPHRLDLRVKAEQIDKTLLTELWPETIRPRTRKWMASRINGGVINGLSISGGFDNPRDAPPEIIYLNGKADLVGADLLYMQEMPPMVNSRTSISFEGKTLRADVLEGEVEGLNLSGSRFILRPTEAGPEGDLALLAKGNFAGAVTLLDQERLNLLKPAGLNVETATGHLDATMSMKWIIPTDDQQIEDTGGLDINLSASVENAALDGLPYNMEYSEGTLDIIYANRGLILNGRGRLNQAPVVLNLERKSGGSLRMEMALEKSQELTAWMATRMPFDLGGETGAVVSLDGSRGMQELILDARLDLDNASINVSRLGVVKLPGEAASLHSRFHIGDGTITAISDIEMLSDVLTANGNVSFDERGEFLGAIFDQVTWPGNDLSSIVVERNAEDILSITAQASIIDLTPLRREESPGEGVSLEIELTSDRIILDEDLSLSGNVVLRTNERGDGTADFLGSLFLANKPFMTQASLNAIFGNDQDLMEGRGLIGGAEASISLSPSENGGDLLVLRSNNAGRVLNKLNITDAVRSGKLYMVTEFIPDQKGHYMVDIELEDFNVIEAPKAVRVMSVLSLAGLYSLLEGDGTNFALGSARLEVSPEKQFIHHARATGSAMAVDLVGVVDPVRRELEVSGTLLPLYGFTKFIGAVPILGEILTGVDNSGLFATQFTISGLIDDPQNSVNLSSIAPGFIRDIFSPNWVRRERERLIPNAGDDNEAAAVADNATIVN